MAERKFTDLQAEAIDIVEGLAEPEKANLGGMGPVRRARVLLRKNPVELTSIKHTLLAVAHEEACEEAIVSYSISTLPVVVYHAILTFVHGAIAFSREYETPL